MKRALPFIALALLTTAGSCPPNVIDALRPPAITANTIPPALGIAPTRVLSANITAGGSGIRIIRIEVRLNRDRDPAHFTNQTPLVFTAPVTQAGSAVVTIPSTVQLAPAQLLTAKWFVDYQLVNGTDVATVESPFVSTRLACSPAQVTSFLRSLQTVSTNPALIPQTLRNPADVAVLAANGYVPTHGFRSFVGMGVAFIGPLPAAGFPAFDGQPHLLLYAPPAGTSAAALNEPAFPDFPYTLIGVAFAAPYAPTGPPPFGCMPRESIFVHEAGWHLAMGRSSGRV